ncbi:MAG: short chain dehydrogenase [Simkania negevensis]|nr:short chain dehydrogenase [Simkania negevensis]
MRIIVIGGNGTIGSAVVKELSERHEILIVGKHRGDLLCDIRSEESIQSMFSKAGNFDALIATVGNVHFEEFSHMTSTKYRIGLDDKLMGQVNLVLIGSQFIQDQGSFTLTSGILNRDPIQAGSSASMVNGALEGFVKGVAIELPRQIRINIVSPTVIAESMEIYGPYFHGFMPIPAAKAALAYSKSVEGLQTGQVYLVV